MATLRNHALGVLAVEVFLGAIILLANHAADLIPRL